MKNKLTGLIVVLFLSSAILSAQKTKAFEIKSPDNRTSLKLEAGAKMTWSVQHEGQQIIAPSSISLQMEGEEVLGDNAKITSSKQPPTHSTFYLSLTRFRT